MFWIKTLLFYVLKTDENTLYLLLRYKAVAMREGGKATAPPSPREKIENSFPIELSKLLLLSKQMRHAA